MAKDSQRPKELTAYAPPAAPRDIGEALAALSEDDFLRLRAIARLRSRSLPGGVSWSDLLHEAVVRALAGVRPWPPGVPPRILRKRPRNRMTGCGLPGWAL
jgi:RNA polymerase sigma-70 factor (ECF subfamily)